MCSYVTLPLYALVTQMGSTMKKSIFDEQTSKALMKWHQKAALKKKSSSRKSPPRSSSVRQDDSTHSRADQEPKQQQQQQEIGSSSIKQVELPVPDMLPNQQTLSPNSNNTNMPQSNVNPNQQQDLLQ